MKGIRLSSGLRTAVFFHFQSAAALAVLCAALFFTRPLSAQTSLWSLAPQERNRPQTEQVPELPSLEKGVLLRLDVATMQQLGQTAPPEFSAARSVPTMVDLPLPDGQFQRFALQESALMEPELAARFPEIKTYVLQGIDDPYASGRLSVSPDEFGAFFTSARFGQEVYIRKAFKNSPDFYLCYWGKDDPSRQKPFQCLWEGPTLTPRQTPEKPIAGPNETGDALRVFRLAMTIPGKLSENYGWTTKAQALAAVVAFLGQLNVIYERDLSVRFVLPAKQDEVIFINSTTDPFTALGGGEAANENILVTNQRLGQDGFDVGLIFVTGACCAAGKPVICGGSKAWNFSAFYSLKVTAHEIGHQFNADHTWTSCGPSNNGQFGTNEYGSGTSIMSYAGLCGVDNILPVGDDTYFGVYSQIQMTDYIKAQTCYKTLLTGNHIPSSSVPANGFYIPISTPFELVGTASDPDGDLLTYSWEQVNIRNIDFTASTISIQTPPTPADGNVPITRIFNPTSVPHRTIPQLPDLLANNPTVYERLPTYSRNLKFRMYVRDNHPGAGGTTHQQVSFEVDGSAGPFLVTQPNTCVSWQAGSTHTITWDVANTDNALVHCQFVKISLSLDGGYHYAYVLAANTPNDGSQTVTLPTGICSNRSRIKIEAVGNIFFDVSNQDFNIETNATPVVKANALQLDGLDDQVEIQDPALGNFGTGDFTIEMWVNTTDNNSALIGKRAICNCDNFWNFFIENGRLRAEFSSSNACNEYLNVLGSNNTLANGNWHHIAFVRQGTSLRFYVDGVLDKTAFSAQNFNNPAKVSIGNIVCGGQNFTGSMDEIRVWNLARTNAQIMQKMNCTLAGNEAGLLAYYPISSQDCGICASDARVLSDKTTHGYDGFLQNGAYTSLSTLNVADCPSCANGPISITTNPLSQSVALGDTATFAVAATGNNLSYQWYRSTNGGASFSEITGATQPVYRLVVTDNGQNGWQFKCYLSNGCEVEVSTPATLTSPCTAQTLSSITGPANPCANNYETYFVTPNPNIVSWSWTTPADWSVTNFGNMIFVKTTATPGSVSVIGTDACGGQTGVQTLAVSPVVVAITTQPVSQTVNEGTDVVFSVAVSNDGGASTFVWQESSDGGATFANIPGAVTATYPLPSVALSYDHRIFRCIVSNACLRDTSEEASLTLLCTNAAPDQPAAISGGSLLCPNVTLSYSIPPVAGATAYQWTLPPGWTGASDSSSITVTANGAGGLLKVKAINGCGASADRVLPVAVQAGPCRRSLHFDGVNDHLVVGQNNQALTGDLTLSFWIKPDVLSGEQTVLFNGREFIVGLSDRQIRYKHSDDCCGYDNTVDMIFPANLDPGVWTHITIVRMVDNRTVRFYLNGNFVQSQTYGANVAQPGNSSTDLILGAGKNGAWLNFKGALDEVRIWGLARSVDELKEDLVCYPVGNEPGLKAYYDFEHGQPYGDNQALTSFPNLASAYGSALVQEMAMRGTSSNVIAGDLPSFLFQDLDGDGYGGASVGCGYAGPTVTNATDCDDQNSAIHPNAVEICNGIDDDCSGMVDDLVNLLASPNVPVAISPVQAVSVSSTLEVNTSVTTLLDLNVQNLNISHTWVADLTVRLRSPQGTEIILFESICGDQNDVLLNFDDEATADYGAIPCPPTNNGTYQPRNPLSAFDGENPNGIWTLTVNDNYPEDGGSLNAWSLRFPSIPLTLYADVDGDGFGNALSSIQACSAQAGYVSNASDCDDSNNQIHPGATEICNGLDDNCDGVTDEGLGTVWYADVDGDGYGNAASTQIACSQPAGYAANSDDCDDNNAGIHPGATEICNGLDDNCDGVADEGLGTVWYVDADGDGYGNAASTQTACSQPAGYAANSDDCDDNNADIHPGATEICNGLDDNCDGFADEGLGTVWYVDADGDGYGNAASTQTACSQPAGYAGNSDDCDDNNAGIHPGATEICNGLDDNCDGQLDENTGAIWYADNDGDGYGNASASIQACAPPASYVGNAEDCDDNNGAINPTASETLNGLDDDCNGLIDDTTAVSSIKPVWGHSGSNQMGKMQFILLPNPADEILRIAFAGDEVTAGRVEIFNPIGQCILTQDIELEPGKEGTFQIGHLPQGYYSLVFRRADGQGGAARFLVVRDGH